MTAIDHIVRIPEIEKRLRDPQCIGVYDAVYNLVRDYEYALCELRALKLEAKSTTPNALINRVDELTRRVDNLTSRVNNISRRI
jgi:hypothetical protein